MKKKVIYIIILTVFSLFLIGLFSAPPERKIRLGVSSVPIQNEKVQMLPGASLPEKVSEFADQIKVSITVSSSTYPLAISVDKSVYESMIVLASTTTFVFKAKYYSGLGYFIEEINTMKNSGGFYWTLYVNGIYANTGASEYILKDGDQVEWKYEKK